LRSTLRSIFNLRSSLLILLAPLLVLAAYQPRFGVAGSLADSPSNITLRGVYAAEGAGVAAQRWTLGRAQVRFAGVGARPYALTLRFHGGADAGGGRVLRVGAGGADGLGATLAQVAIRPAWQELRLQVPAAAVDAATGDVVIGLDVPTIRAGGDPRLLGVALQAAALRPLGEASPALPPWGRAAQLAAALLLAFGSLRLAGLRPWAAFAASAALGAALACGLATARIDAAILLELALRVLPWTLGLSALLFLIFDFRLWKARSTYRGAIQNPKSKIQNSAVLCAALLIFTLRLGGLLHPQYILIDQRLRANQIAAIAEGQVERVRPQLDQQYEWGTREPVPYSLLTYYLMVPLAWLWRDNALVTAVEAASVLFDASVPLLLAALAVDGRRATGDWQAPDVAPGRATRSLRLSPFALRPASFAALTYAALPVGYLFFHDGSFPTTIGVWFVLVALLAVRLWLSRGAPLRSPWFAAVVALIALALVAYVTHIAFASFLLLALAGALWLGGGRRAAALRLGLALGMALAIDWLLYYRDYTVALVRRTIPALLGQIAAEGSVGRDTDLLYNTAVNSFGQHLAAHFRVWPALLAAAALLVLLSAHRWRFATHVGLAYALFLGATSVAERWFGLWNKHMAFAAPGVALLAGIGLALLWRRGRAGRALCVALLALLLWQSSVAWGNRVLWYVLPAEAL
jgi:hypothetical protein